MKMMMKNREQRLIASLVNEKSRLADTAYRFLFNFAIDINNATIIWEMIQEI